MFGKFTIFVDFPIFFLRNLILMIISHFPAVINDVKCEGWVEGSLVLILVLDLVTVERVLLNEV